MRGRRGYKGLLRGNATMLGRVQIRKLHLATFLHAIWSHWFGFIFWSGLILLIADCIVRSEFGSIRFSRGGLEWLALAAFVVFIIFVVAAIAFRCAIKSDPYLAARDDVERILIEVRDSRGRRATVERIAGINEAEFISDFYEIKSFGWLGILALIAMFGLLVAGGIPHVIHYKNTYDRMTQNYLSVENDISTALQQTGLCDEIYLSDSAAIIYGSHYVKCVVKFEEDRELYLRVDLDSEYYIDELSYHYAINQDIAEIPQLNLVNDYIIVLQMSLSLIEDLPMKEDLLSYNYQIDEEFIAGLEKDGYQRDYSVFRDATSEDAKHRVYLSYSYTKYTGEAPNNYIYISSN